ncbi:MAG: hypothetical protein JXA49_03720 [Actinobacteria bacterium]|nr:hypothetical protein [Actinomycetota bacterium]
MVEAYAERDQRGVVQPLGDFVALVGAFMALLFPVFLNWYSMAGAGAKTGISTAAGIIAFVPAVVVLITALIMLVGRFRDPLFRLNRSPGWIYASAASVIFMVTVVGLVAPPRHNGTGYGLAAGIILEIFAAVVIGIGAGFKFNVVQGSAGKVEK